MQRGYKPGKKVNKEAVKTMREIGYDLSDHEPTHISEFSDIAFDYIAKMDVPDLGDMVTAKWIADWNIPDPAQGGETEYRTIREMICASVDVVIQAARLRDGSRKITHVSEVMGMEGDVFQSRTDDGHNQS